MLKQLFRMIDVYKSKKKIVRKAKKLGNNILINDKVKINNNTYIGNNVGINGLTVREQGKLIIGNNVGIAKGCIIFTGGHNYRTGLPFGHDYLSKDVIIEDNVWIGQNVIILGKVTIGEGAVIQAGSIVSLDIPPLAIAGGNPAKPFKYRDRQEYEQLKNEKKYHKITHKKRYMINPY